MSYHDYLKEHYKAVRKRMLQNAIPEPKALPKPTNESSDLPKGGLVSELQDEQIVSEALTVVRPVNSAQALRLAEEIENSPRLPPLPGLNLNEPGAIRWMRIIHAVAKKYEVDPEEIMGICRRRIVVVARFEIFYRLRVDLAFSYPKISHIMKKDHSTVIHGVNKIRKKLLDENKRLADDGVAFWPTHPGQNPDTSPNLSVG